MVVAGVPGRAGAGAPVVAVLLEQCLAPVPGGTGRYAREVAAALAEQAPTGASVAGWTAWHRDPGPARVPGVSGPRRLPLPRRVLVAAWERGAGPSLRRADLVHAPTPLYPPAAGVPLVVTVHDAVPWTHPDTLTPRGVRWHRSVIGRAARTADAVVVPTAAVADELTRHVEFRRPPIVVGEGVSPALALPPDAVARAAALALPTSGYVVTLATIEPRKGLDVLLAAMARPDGPDLPLLVVGQGGWGGVDVAARAAELGIADRVRLLGRLPDADLAVVLDRATVLAAPSRAEGFGLPVLEAMAVGLPVVSSDAPALKEVGGGATVTVPVGDDAALAGALGEVVASGELRRSLAVAGAARAQQFTWTAAAQRLWELYDGLL